MAHAKIIVIAIRTEGYIQLSASDYAPLHTHTSFSALDGLPKVHEIVDRVVELGQKGFAVTDHGVMSGIPQFYEAAQEKGLIFAPGIEMYFTGDRKKHAPDFYGQKYYHLILLAHNNEGYKNLSRLQRRTWTEGYYYKPRADFELLQEYSEGLTVTTACLGSMFNQALLRDDMKFARSHLNNLIDIFGKENVYIEVQNHGSEEDKKVIPGQLQLAKEMGVELLATNDSHYCSPDDYESHDLLLCTSTGSKRDDEKRFRFDNDQFYMKSADEMFELFPEDEFPRAVTNTAAFLDKVDFSLPMGDKMEYLMPHVPSDMLGGKTEAEALRELVAEGLRDPSRYGDEDGNIPEEAESMAKYELGVIENMGFPGYFLIVKHILDLFRANGIAVGAGRGSAPGSIVSYALGITGIDPIENKLLFWRFLSPDRISMPDIDSDIPKSKRQKALALLKEEFGADRIAQLTTYSEMKDKDAIQRAAKSIGYLPTQADFFKKATSEAMEIADVSLQEFANLVIQYTFDNYNIVKDANGYGKVEVPLRGKERLDKERPKDYRVRQFIETVSQKFPDYHTILKTAAAFVDTISSYSVHACGLVITPMPIDDLIPVREPKKDSGVLPVTQYDGDAVEAMGGVKIDILGIQTLDACIDTERNILEDLGEEVDSSNLETNDKAVYETLSAGEGKGVFQMSCLTGDTVVDGRRLDTLYSLFEDKRGPDVLRSVRFNNGLIANNRVRAVVKTGVKDVYELKTSSNRVIKATAGHRFFTGDSWKRLDELTPYSDSVLVVPSGKGNREYPHRFLSDRERIQLLEEMTGRRWHFPYGGEVTINGTNYKLTAVSHDGSEGVITYSGSDNKVSSYKDKYKNILVLSDNELVENYGESVGIKCALPICSRKETVVSIRPVGKAETYDIAMHEPFHNYIANDFVVHNSGGMRRLMADMKPDKFDDIVALGALYRPGPLGMGVHHQYADRKNGREEVSVIHPDAMEILEDSYGLCLTGDTELAVVSDDTGVTKVTLRDLGSMDNPFVLGINSEGKAAPGKVTKWWSLGNKETWHLILANGTKLRGSFDHPVLTGRGWLPLSDITDSDVVATMGSVPSGRAFSGVPERMLSGSYSDVSISGVVPTENIDEGDVYHDEEGGYSPWISWEPVLMSAPTGMTEEVFDISVPDNENFLAGSIVTHNCIYQEHIMSIARKFADFTGGESDELRKAMGKKIPEMMEKQREKFINGVNKKYPGNYEYVDERGNKVSGPLGEAWWQFIEPHANYGFNKSHSVAYAILSYRTAWLKTHYPAQFGAASIDIDSQGSDKNKNSIGEHIDWLSRFGVSVKAPDINKSIMRGVTTRDSITLPMHIVRGIGNKRATAIIKEREENGLFSSVIDAVERCKLNAGEIRNLSLAGAFESLGADRFQVINKIDEILEEAKNLSEHNKLSEGLFSFSVSESDYKAKDLDLGTTPVYCDIGDGGEMEVSRMSLRKIENSVLGLSVQPHPYSMLEKGIRKKGLDKRMLSPAEVNDAKDGTKAKIYGILSNCTQKMSKNGKAFTVFNISSLDTEISAIRFDEMNIDADDEIPVIVKGKIVDDTFREGTKKVIVDGVQKVNFRVKKEG